MMKKLLVTILSIFLICPVIGHFSVVEVAADISYKVAYIEDDGSLTTVASFSNFNEAKAKMKENGDYVVTCDASKSPSKIVAMNSGLVYSYPVRSNSETINIFEKVNSDLSGSGTLICVSSNYEMTYHDTYSTTYSSTAGYLMGWIKVTLNGFTGYADLEYCDLVPSKYIEKEIPITLGGAPSRTFDVICKQKYYSVEKTGNYSDLVLHYYLGISSSSSKEAVGYTLHLGVAPSFMEEGKRYYSNDGINFFEDRALSKLKGTYYNYYQFAPARTYSAISGNTLNSYLKSKGYNSTSDSVMYGTGNDFIKDQNKYGVNGALIFAMAIHESGYGTSPISRSKFNLFGWGAFDENTSAAKRYDSVYECVKAQMADNLSNYLDESSGNYYFSMGIGNKGGGFALKYASDPYWSEKIASHYYSIDKYSKGNNGELTDYNSETLALITTVGAKIYKKDNVNSGVWYTTENKKTSYQKNLVAVVLEIGKEFTRVRTSNNIDENGLLKPIEMPAGYIAPYNAETSYGYIKNSDLEILNNGNKPLDTLYKQKEVDEASLISSNAVLSLNFNGTKVVIDGLAYFKGLDFDYEPIIKHELVVKNIETGNKAYFPLTTSEREGFTLNDGNSYKYINYNGTCDLKDLIQGQFVLGIKVTNGKYSKEMNICSSESQFANMNSVVDGSTYHIYQNEQYGYRLELEKFSSPFDYSLISKPSTRKSFFDLLEQFKFESSDDDLNLTLNAASMIYYCNYDNEANVSYDVYLVQDKDNYLKLDTSIVEKPEGYGNGIFKNYDTTNIAFAANGNIKELSDGLYEFVIEIHNGSYVDYLNAFVYQDYDFPQVTIENKTFTIYRNQNNNRIYLSVVTTQGD